MPKKELSTEHIKVRPSTKKRLDKLMTTCYHTYDGVITDLLDEVKEK